jgi:hypothetical protein
LIGIGDDRLRLADRLFQRADHLGRRLLAHVQQQLAGSIDPSLAPPAVEQVELECSPKSDPGVMKVYQPRSGGRTFDDQEETKAFA